VSPGFKVNVISLLSVQWIGFWKTHVVKPVLFCLSILCSVLERLVLINRCYVDFVLC
jgi:hypothetical protein